MKNLILYSDANEKFKYKLTLEGARIEDTSSRLCLEFDSGENIYFKGKLDQNGGCTVNIKALKNFEGKGTAKIEVIAEKTYFTIHEMPFEVKKKIDVKFNESVNEDFGLEVEEKKPTVGITFERTQIPKQSDITAKESEIKPLVKKERQPKKKDDIKGFNDFIK